MIGNSIRVRLAFSFKGETLDLDSVVDLDRCLRESHDAPNFHRLLALAGGIDPYSYQYEMLESDDIEFSDPTGLAVACCGEGCFDWPAFVRLQHDAEAFSPSA